MWSTNCNFPVSGFLCFLSSPWCSLALGFILHVLESSQNSREHSRCIDHDPQLVIIVEANKAEALFANVIGLSTRVWPVLEFSQSICLQNLSFSNNTLLSHSSLFHKELKILAYNNLSDRDSTLHTFVFPVSLPPISIPFSLPPSLPPHPMSEGSL